MGRHSYARPQTPWYRGDPPTTVTIGNFTSIAEGVTITTGGGHPLERVSLFPFRARWQLPGAYADGHPSSRGNVVIGSDVWIVREAKILSGVTIGHGAVWPATQFRQERQAICGRGRQPGPRGAAALQRRHVRAAAGRCVVGLA